MAEDARVDLGAMRWVRAAGDYVRRVRISRDATIFRVPAMRAPVVETRDVQHLVRGVAKLKLKVGEIDTNQDVD